MPIFEPLFQALNQAQVRYVVVGGLATVLHGYARLTADVDIVVDLAPAPAQRVIDVLLDLGLQPRVPVEARDFAVRDRRRGWIEEKGMQVFSMYDPANPLRAVDLFVHHQVPFEDLWDRSVVVPLRDTSVRIASIPDLIYLKELADRPQDREDIAQLREILESRERDDG